MAKQLNVNLAFSADTGKAKAQIQDLQNSLNNLVKSSAAGAVSKGLPITKDLMEAQTAASKLQTILSQSMNTKTGNLDLTKFSESLNKANLNITKLENSLTKLGPEGQKAFMSLTQSIVSADVPLRRTNALVSEMWTTMKNTARWQLSSSVLHGFMGSLQSAMGYARDLDESLNNIRIVTGQNVDQMAAFADRANKAAKALSATTTQYTNASLIYYQQGLSDAEVQERADITIKMAHASGQSAEIVSDQLTAVWNNFAKGGEDLEHFADVMTALGAATASSSDEIAGGLEKFASIAEMIGLSYEYAASALATITATTRQSEDVVGTALKTIFARIQGLNLGETLDDGTTLNKYSEALQKVGISIYEQNGELKDMDNILNEMGAKWDTLSKDQQVALAQTVAGVRQYNQLVSLMDNWDFFQENLNISNNSEGALQEQADIYAESWQAARDRVKAAAQDIYDSILDPDFFITFLDGLENVLSGIGNLTDALGGLPGVLSLLGVIGTQIFSEQLAGSVEKFAFNIKSVMGFTKQEINKLQNDALQAVSNINFNTGTEVGDAQAEVLKARLNIQREIKQVADEIGKEEQEQLNALLQINDAYAEQWVTAAKLQDEAGNRVQESRQKIREKITRATQGDQQGRREEAFRQLNEASAGIRKDSFYGIDAAEALDDISKNLKDADKHGEKFKKTIDRIKIGLEKGDRAGAVSILDDYVRKFKQNEMSADEFKNSLNGLVTRQEMLADVSSAASGRLQQLKQDFNLTDQEIIDLANDLGLLTQREMETLRASAAFKSQLTGLQQQIQGFKGALDTFGKSMVKIFQGVSSVSMGIMSLKSAFETLNNTDLSAGEKALQISMSLGMAIPSLIMGIEMLTSAQSKQAMVTLMNATAKVADEIATLAWVKATLIAESANTGFIASLYKGIARMVAAKIEAYGLAAGMGVLAAAIAAAVLIIYVLVKAFEALQNSTPEAKLNRLKEETEKAGEAFDRLNNSINETKTAIDNLESSYDKIKNLKEGTAEWNEEIAKTNAQVLELIDKYPQLNEYLMHDENGLLYLDEQGLKQFQQEQQNQLVATSNAHIGAQIREKEEILSQTRYDKVENMNLSTLPKGMTATDVFDYMAAQSMSSSFGDMLYNSEGIKMIVEELYGEYTEELGAELLAAAKANRGAFEDIGNQWDTINILKESQISSQLASMGSVRGIDSALGLAFTGTDIGSYENFEKQNREEFEKTFGNWIDNGEFRGNQLDIVNEFAKLQGLDGAEYTGQNKGEIKFKLGEEEFGFTEDEFFNFMTDTQSTEKLREMMLTNIRDTLSDALTFENANDLVELSDEALINLDNLQYEIVSNVYGDVENEKQKTTQSKKAFQAVTGAYAGEDGKLSNEELERVGEDTQYIEWNTENINKFKEAIDGYDGSKEKIEGVTTALREMNAAGQMDTMGDTFANAAQTLGLDDEAAQDMHEYAKHLMEIADESENLSDELDEDADAAAKLAIQITRMNKGIDTLAENYEDWGSILKKSSKESAEYSKAMGGIKNALADILDIEADFVSEDFVTEHLADIEKAATGNAEAIDRLRAALGEQVILDIVGVDKFAELPNNLQTAIKSMQDYLADNKLDIGQSIELNADGVDDTGFIEKCNQVIASAGMTADEANAYFDSMGFEAEFETEQQPVLKTGHGVRTVTTLEPPLTVDLGDGKSFQVPGGWEQKTYPGEEYQYVDYVDAIAMETKTNADGSTSKSPKIKKITKKATGSFNNYSSSNSGGKPAGGKKGGGGGGSKSKPAEKVDLTKRSDVVDRYKEIDDTLADIEDAMSDVNKEADRLFGSARLKAMRQEKDLLLQQADALKKKKLEAQEYMEGNIEKGIKGDRQELIDVSAKYGITWNFGKDGDILNYTEQMNNLFNELNAAEIKMNGLATKEAQDEFKTATIEPIQQKIEDIKNALSQYEDTKELLKDLDNQLQEAIWAWEDKNFEELEYKLELKLDIDDADLKHLDYLMNKWSDDFFKMAETAALMASPTGEYDQIEGYSNQLKNYREHELALDEKYANKEISQADYIEGLKNVRDGYYEQLEALNELDKTMLHYYEDTLSAASEELDDYTDHMEHLTGVFDHYLNLMDLLGKQKDFDALGDFLGGKAETTRDQLNVAKEYYDMLLEQKEETEREYNKAIRSGDKESIKFWQEQWDAIVDATDEAQEEMLSLTEAWVENMRAVIQNNMDKLAADLEKSLTGKFMNFDVLMDSFDKLNTRQEEYLTKTNQIYETNKLIRQASQKIDETDNKVAKQKMQNFITETKSLQENNQLSEYELEIQQAKYELLLAEIALEEAQNAKSTVRLSRDSEGNFGYIYTADQDAVDDAEQGLDDAKNRLYNLSLEGQQEYTEKYLQAQQSMYEELTELQQMFLDGELASEEEYQLRKEEIINHYYGENGILRTYSNLYNIAVQTDAAATADYWGKQYGAMTQATDDWQVAVNEYLEEVEEETEEWADVSKQANRDVEGALKNSSKATKDLTDESDKLGKEIKNDLIPAMDEEFERVKDAIIAYDNERDAIRKMREEYEKYIETINKNIKKASEDEINKTDDDHFKKDYSLSALINAAEGDMDAAYKDIDKRNEKIKDDGNYSDKTSSSTKKKVDAVDKLSDSQKEAIASSLKYLKEQGKYTTEQVDIILKQNGASFATGGFTGAWGPEGKLAFLHEKELVLNQDDTSNLLKTISFIREIVSMIDSQASSANLGFLSTPGFSNAIDHNFEQTVSIYAEFPSATNHTEIEEAFNNLLNTASQYANRKE